MSERCWKCGRKAGWRLLMPKGGNVQQHRFLCSVHLPGVSRDLFDEAQDYWPGALHLALDVRPIADTEEGT